MVMYDSVYGEKTIYAFKRTIFNPVLRPAFYKVIFSIFTNFFLSQWIMAFLPGKAPITKVDHPIDEKIPFVPAWVAIYIDFAQFWIRVVSFFIRRYGRRSYTPIKEFIISIADLYAYASQVYKKNLSTTKRPFYISRPRFLMIHLLDPHLMCIPSLHVMVVVHAYKQFIQIAKKLGEEEKLKEQIQEMKQGALAISQAILFVKQHSVNCIPAALYAMTNHSPDLFPPEEVKDFINLLFSPPPGKEKAPTGSTVHPAASPLTKISEADQVLIKSHIHSLYTQFLSQRDPKRPWYDPLLQFLGQLPRK